MSFLKKHREWFVSAGAGLLIAAAVILFERSDYDQSVLLRMLCDGAFVAGIFLTGFGALIMVAAEGGFDAMGFAIHTLLRKFSPRKDRFASRQTYSEYKAARHTKKRPNVKCVLLTGLAYIALAGVLLALYYR